VPRHVIDALVRGIERKPTARWPSMPVLLAALAPAPRPRRWPVVVAGLVGAGAATTGALVFVMVDRGPSLAGAPTPLHVLAPPALAAVPVAVGTPQAPVTRIAASGAPGNSGPVTTTDYPAVRESTTITLRLTVDPPVAAIAVDGARVQGTEIVVPKDAAAHLLKITAAGYHDYNAISCAGSSPGLG